LMIILIWVCFYCRSKWPKRISFKLIVQFLLLALGG
jgi:hypothetical protein